MWMTGLERKRNLQILQTHEHDAYKTDSHAAPSSFHSIWLKFRSSYAYTRISDKKIYVRNYGISMIKHFIDVY